MSKLKNFLWNVCHEIESKIHPRDNSIVLMGAWFGNRFADNARYLYQYLAENKDEIGLSHVVWVTRSKQLQQELSEFGYEVYMMDSDESLYFHKKSGIHIICNNAAEGEGKPADILTKYSCGAFKINLWHGLGGIKGVSYISKEYIDAKKKKPIAYAIAEWLRKRKWYRRYVQLPGGWGDTYYLTTTPFETAIFEQYFLLKKPNFIESGYPRNQQNVTLRKCEIEVIEKIKQKKLSILYMPTFRENNQNYIAPLSDSEMVKTIEKSDWMWIEKKHGADQSDLLAAIKNDSVLQLESDFDANVILPYIDIVITDYSSVSWDALYHGKPVIFYMPDFTYYMENDRGFVLKPEEFIIGPVAYCIRELQNHLEKYQNDLSAMLPENRDEIFEKIWGQKTDCEQIWQDIQSEIGGTK